MRDYAKKSNYNKRHNNFNSTWLLMLLFFCAMGFAGYESYHFVKQKWLLKKEKVTIHTNTNALPHKKIIKTPVERTIIVKQQIVNKKPMIRGGKMGSTKKVGKQKETIALNPADIQPKYDFYQLLPEMTVTIPAKDKSLSTSAAIASH